MHPEDRRQDEEPVPVRKTGRLSQGVQWIRTHKVRTLLYILLLYFLVELLTIPFFSIARLRTENPGETALMRQRKEEAAEARRSLKIAQRWTPLSRIPMHVVNAIVVAEDGTFFSHNGVDWFEVQESIEKNIRQKRMARGASTITQQLAKNLYLSTSKNPMRKLKELLITVLLEQQLTKRRILELYINVIEWGRGIFGIEAASQTYFGKSASELTLEEAARLAAVIPSPLRHRADADSKYVVRRQQIVLNRMRARNFIEVTPSKETKSNQPPESRLEINDSSPLPDSSELIYPTDVDEDTSDGL